MFGPHLILEGYKCKNKKALEDKATLIQILNDLPPLMNMNAIMPAHVLYYDGGDIPLDKGLSGFIIIAESHIAIHTFPEKEFFTLDIFSCKDFEAAAAISYINKFYMAEHCDHSFFERGREFPRSMARACEIVSSERNGMI